VFFWNVTLRHGVGVSAVSSEPSGLTMKVLKVLREWLMTFVFPLCDFSLLHFAPVFLN
jgi:hypothetical protein